VPAGRLELPKLSLGGIVQRQRFALVELQIFTVIDA
jgi:hypothetical protein